jgi:hypothetical protein
MRLDQQIPGIRGIAIILTAAALTFIRQFGLLSKILEFFAVGTNHQAYQAYDLIGALLVEPVLVIIRDRISRLLVAARNFYRDRGNA